MVAHKYAHSNARYRRNLVQGKVRMRSRRDERSSPAEVYDVARRQYVHQDHHTKRQSSSSGTTGSVELTDCKQQQDCIVFV